MSGDAFAFGSPTSFNVRAECLAEEPYLRFVAGDSGHQGLVDKIATEAIRRTLAMDFGGEVWFSTTLREVELSVASSQFMGALLQRLGGQVRIIGWRRLGRGTLLEFTEEKLPDGEEKELLLAPRAVVKVHVAAPGPWPGHFASNIAHGMVEAAAAICSFALGRPVELPLALFPAERKTWAELGEHSRDASIRTLARKGIPLDIIGWADQPGGPSIFQRVQSALLTFDAALKQSHADIASILCVVAAECLTVPSTSWRTEKLTRRFRDFYEELMPDVIDEIINNANFEEAFGVNRGIRTQRVLRREALNRIYSFRSGQLHEGLSATYRGMDLNTAMHARRALLVDFAEAAILHFLQYPRSSLIGHPLYSAKDKGAYGGI